MNGFACSFPLPLAGLPLASPLPIPSLGVLRLLLFRSRRQAKLHICAGKLDSHQCQAGVVINQTPAEDQVSNNALTTGGAYGFEGATTSLTNELMPSSKRVTLIRHGLSTWNEQSRVQGSSNLSILTETGIKQAERCRNSLVNMTFDACFSSPISRAKSTAEILWQGKQEPLIFLDSLKEAHLFFLEGMTNADAKKQYPELYTSWREDPANFHVAGIYPIRKLWGTAREAWKEILLTPGENFLVVTHKSILRALICTALGLTPERFRAIDVNNGGISVFKFSKQGEAMLQCLNMTAHMYSDHIYNY
ncbi:Histidine phosphatase superfamily clade-1 protein [Dioscorea alata]|uniref:Histidine phosphatase superfamily clade-1 protein n=1 Tax=Dioscorea alata TaxID=55571 RepID=A0ACB7W465_DIOAL|nr:Histidine phosphatase superfamily clade-1 protein [Dioscorea alata]